MVGLTNTLDVQLRSGFGAVDEPDAARERDDVIYLLSERAIGGQGGCEGAGDAVFLRYVRQIGVCGPVSGGGGEQHGECVPEFADGFYLALEAANMENELTAWL